VTGAQDHGRPAISDAQLRAALEGQLTDYFGTDEKIVRLQRARSEYSSSFAIEELELELGNGRSLSLVFKDLGSRGLLRDARRTKPGFLFDPNREIEVYRSILSQSESGTAAFYGSVVIPEDDTFCLFLERVPGLELYQLGEFEYWLETAKWLANFHQMFQEGAGSLAARAPLVRYDRGFYTAWLDRAPSVLRTRQAASPGQIEVLKRGYRCVLERLLTLPVTLLHGDFYPSNVIVQNDREKLRICAVDWEMAAIGPGIIDLAALVSGGWTGQQESELILAYLNTLSNRPVSPAEREEFFKAVNWGRLHVAIQWLGWSPQWSPPEEHKQDWLGIALEMIDRLGL